MSEFRSVFRRSRDPATTRQLWTDRLHRFRAAGQTVAAFCRHEGVSVPNFYYWKRQLDRIAAPTDPPTIVPVRISPLEPTAAPALEVILPSGAQVRFGPTGEPALIAAVLRQIGVSGC